MAEASVADARRAALRALVEGHRPADATEAAHREAFLALLAGPGDPFSRDHFSPGHVTASAFVLSPSGDALLMIHHGKLDRWLQPGGHVEPEDPDLPAAARREVAEETGVTRVTPAGTGLFDLDVHLIPARRADPAHHHFDVRVLLRAETLALAAGEEVRAARWVPLDEVHTLDPDGGLHRALARLRPEAAGTRG